MLFLSRYEAFESESESDLPGDFLELFEDEMLGSDRLLSLLTALDVKPASDVEGFFDSKESFEDFISLMNSAGLNCYVEYDPSETEAESMMGLFEEEGADVSLLEDYEVKARIFLTREEYSTGFFRRMKFFKKFYTSKYHRMYGSFLGFREKDIEAFLRDQGKDLEPESGSRDAVRPEELAERYGEELSDAESKAFEALHFGLMENSEDRYSEGVEEMQERRRILEESDFDADELIEERTFE